MTLLDEIIPRADFAELHERTIAARRRRVWEALHEVTLGEMRLTRTLFALRSLPERLAGRRRLPNEADAPVLAQMLAFGFARLGEQPEQELVAGVIAQTWRPGGEIVAITGLADFASFDRAGFVKAAMNFELAERADSTALRTETRVVATSAGARRAFRAYWLAIRAGSGAIRRDWLRAIARRAERGVASGAPD